MQSMDSVQPYADSSVGGYVPTPTPAYAPGDDVLVGIALPGRETARARVRRVVPIAPLSDATVRYLYLLSLEEGVVSSLVADEEMLRPISPRR